MWPSDRVFWDSIDAEYRYSLFRDILILSVDRRYSYGDILVLGTHKEKSTGLHFEALLETVIRAHIKGICSLSPTVVSIACVGGQILLHDIAQNRCLGFNRFHRTAVRQTCFFRNKTILASGGWDNAYAVSVRSNERTTYQRNVLLWRVDEEEDYSRLKRVGTLPGHWDRVECLRCFEDAFPDRLLSGGRDKRGRIWDVEKLVEIGTLIGHSSFVAGIDLSPCGKQIVTAGSRDCSMRFWDSRTFQDICCVQLGAVASSVFWSTQHEHDVVVGCNSSVSILDVRNLSQPRLTWEVGTGHLFGSVEISDSRFAMSSTGRGRVGCGRCYVYSFEGKPLMSRELQGRSFGICYVPSDTANSGYGDVDLPDRVSFLLENGRFIELKVKVGVVEIRIASSRVLFLNE